jgi:regulator of nucleoside diphosphate kinase
VIFRDDAPPTLATINSRVTYSVNGRKADTRVLSHARINAPTGLFLPITTPRGLALLGLMEGQEFSYLTRDGEQETIRLDSVLYQPEAARQEKEAAERLATPDQRRSKFRVISNAAPAAPAYSPPTFDDPGPSAA